MAPPNDPNSKAPDGQDPPDSGEVTPHPRFDEQLEGDAFEVMRKYQVVTMPPNARLKLMQIALPTAPPELLQDTVPPNGNLVSPAPASTVDTVTDAPVVDASRSNRTLIIPRVRRQQRFRKLVVAALVATVAVIALGAFLWPREEAPLPSDAESAAPVVASPNDVAEVTPTPTVAPSIASTPAPTTSASASKAAFSGTSPGPAKPGSHKSTPLPGAKATSAASKPQPEAPAPSPPTPSTARGKQPWIDGL